MSARFGLSAAGPDVISEVIEKIVSHFHPEKVIVFGSQAWGSPGEASDLDVLVIMESGERPRARAARVAHSCQPPYLPMDILVRTPAEIAERVAIGDSFIQRILDEGRVMYDRSSR
jgi:predicted nucleotidyltransferase